MLLSVETLLQLQWETHCASTRLPIKSTLKVSRWFLGHLFNRMITESDRMQYLLLYIAYLRYSQKTKTLLFSVTDSKKSTLWFGS